MAKKALILNGEVVQVEAKEFPVAEPLEWVTCPNNVERGFTYDGAKFTAPPAVVDVTPEPSDIEVRLKALEQKAGITAADKEAARLTLKGGA